MGVQARWYAVSAAGHLALLLTLALIGAGRVVKPKVVAIDFTLNAASTAGAERAAQKEASRASRSARQEIPLPERQASAPGAPAPDPESPIKALRQPVETQPAVPVSAPASEGPAAARGVERAVGRTNAPVAATAAPARGGGAAAPSSPSGGEGPAQAEKARNAYLREHFAYIRDLILKRLVYPQPARRMGWSGKVTVSFVVEEDGSVGAIRVAESSGIPLLDRSAVDTVRTVAPFPKPPVKAEIVLPITFRLNRT